MGLSVFFGDCGVKSSLRGLGSIDASDLQAVQRKLSDVLSGLARLQQANQSSYDRGVLRFRLTQPFRLYDPATSVGAAIVRGGRSFADIERDVHVAFSEEWIFHHGRIPSLLVNDTSFDGANKKLRAKFPYDTAGAAMVYYVYRPGVVHIGMGGARIEPRR